MTADLSILLKRRRDCNKRLSAGRHLCAPDKIQLAADGAVLAPGNIVRRNLSSQIHRKSRIDRNHMIILCNHCRAVHNR